MMSLKTWGSGRGGGKKVVVMRGAMVRTAEELQGVPDVCER